MITACTLAALLLVEAAPSADCELMDNRCKVKLYERQAAAASTPGERAKFLFGKYRSHLYLFQETGDSRELCAAQRALRATLAVKGQPDAQRASFQAHQVELKSHERELGIQCSTRKPRRPPDAKVAPIATAPPTDDLSGSAPPAAAAAPPPLMAVSPSEPLPAERTKTDVFMPVSPEPVTRPPPRVLHPPRPEPRVDGPRPGRGFVIAGGVTLGVGVAFTAAAGVAGGQMLDTRREILALGARVHGWGTMEQVTKDRALRRDFQSFETQTIAFAVAGGATVLVAAVLAGVGGRRMARAASQTAVFPAPGGLVFRARF